MTVIDFMGGSEDLKKTDIAQIYQKPENSEGKSVTVQGWIRTIRDSKSLGFIDLNDGSGFKGIQIVFEDGKVENYKEIAKLNVGTAISVLGTVVLTPQAKQPLEIHAVKIAVEGASTPDYPLQKKRHSLEYLRTIAHLRPRTNTFSAAFRIRSAAAYAIHEFFQQRGFLYAHTPLITGSDAEGAGEMFTVTALDLDHLPQNDAGKTDFTQDFFGGRTSLTVSGQLEAECMAMAFGKVYTFGPTFRAERSNTQRHAAEFWMIEPEIAFADLEDDMELAQDMMRSVIRTVMERCPDDLAFCNRFIDKGLLERLKHVANSDFARVSYTEAVEILKKENDRFEYPVEWGCDLQTEHERFLTEQVFKKPLFVTDYPKDIKAFYMRLNDDGKTVSAVDLLVPGIGEIIGGSQREERLDVLERRMQETGMNEDAYRWYLDLRRYGGTKHAGYGLGFERLVMYLTGISNIRDVIPFPRTTGSAEF
jgi:asparaginyl-tRNA synthetase